MARAVFNLFLFIGSVFSSIQAAEETSPPSPSKKILVLCSNGGFSHNAAANTLKSLLGKEYDLKVVYPIDQMRFLGAESGEGVYNSMLRGGWIRSMNAIAKHIAPKLFRTRKQRLERIVDTYLENEKPDLVISLIPFVNYPASEAARKKGIPYLLITIDNDLRTWVHGLQGVTHPAFKVTISADLPSTRPMLHRRNIADSVIETTGLPLRPEFMTAKMASELYEEYGIDAHKPVILIVMGGAGGETALEYTRILGRTELGAHFIVCAGKNNALARKLKKIALHPSNSITVMKFTDKMAELMALSDLLITKPGPGTLNEAIAMQLPVLIDGTSPPLSWERVNIRLVEEYGIGEPLRSLEDAPAIVKKYLYDPAIQQKIAQAFSRLPPSPFNKKIPEIVKAMCSTNEGAYAK